MLGRKNWRFAGTPKAASASAFWYSLIQTAKANGKDPNEFLLQFLKGLPAAKTTEDMRKLFNDSMGLVKRSQMYGSGGLAIGIDAIVKKF